MKIVTWNVNGIRSIKGDIPRVLNDLNSDIICFQETKVSRSQLPENIAIVDDYQSFFSYPRKQSGYSGVATYCKDKFTPVHAEEGLVLKQVNIDETYNGFWDDNIDEIDFEGRVMVTQHLIKYNNKICQLAVINVYCPRVDPDKPERHFYKMKFCHILQSKMIELCRQDCFVIIVGDLNIACSMIDHCDPGDEKEFKSSEARVWLNSFFTTEVQVAGEKVKAIDAFRHFYPYKEEAYTCWNTKTGARLTNYGTRIDYIIVSSNLLPLLSTCEILSDFQGSDHCPVFAEFKCDSVPNLNMQLPSICTRLWPEFSGHQQKLQAFFQKAQNIADAVTKNKEQRLSTNTSLSKKNKQKSIKSFFGKRVSSNHSSANSSQESTTDNTTNLYLSADTCNMTEQENSINLVSQEIEKKCISANKSNEWKSLLCGPPKPPMCAKHKKPCVLRTVKKNGPNLGRQFFMCSQPVGAITNPESNCNFFQWVTTPKVNALKNS